MFTKIPCFEGASLTSVVIDMFSNDITQEVSKNGTIKPPLPVNTLFLSPVITIALSAGTFLQNKKITTTNKIKTGT